jgi:hypothetical protein
MGSQHLYALNVLVERLLSLLRYCLVLRALLSRGRMLEKVRVAALDELQEEVSLVLCHVF